MKTNLRSLLLICAALAMSARMSRSESSSVTLQFAAEGSGVAGRLRFELGWIGVSGGVYRLQFSPSLEPGVSWETLDVLSPPPGSSSLTYELAERQTSRELFRLQLPAAEIFNIEPAMFALGGAVEFYVIGQCFDAGTTLRSGQLVLSNLTTLSPGLMRGSFVPPAAGTYVFELLQGGDVVSAFQVECFDAIAPPPHVLQEPQDEPWASPTLESGPFEEGVQGFASAGRPRVTPSGEVELGAVDMCVPGRGLDFVWGRRYRSLSGPNTAQGNRWDFSYNVSARQIAGGIEVRDGTGRADVFAQDAGGTFVRDGHFSAGMLTGSVFRLTFADTGYWEFLPFDGLAASGKLARIVDRNGNAMLMEYDATGRLVRVIDTLGRTFTIAYLVNGKISSVTDFTGRRVVYTYYTAADANGGNGDLRTVNSPAVTGTPNGNDFPQGKTTTYTYSRGFANPRENSLLLAITNPRNQIAHRHIYQHNQTDLQFLRCTSQQAGTVNDTLTFHHVPLTPAPTNRFAVQKLIVNDRIGNVSERFFDARHRLLLQRDYTGRATPGVPVTETTNRPVNKLRATDPDFFDTGREWNNDSLCTRVVFPRGNESQYVYEREFNPAASARKKGDLRVLRQLARGPATDVDRDGIPDLAARAWRFDYDPRFGSRPFPGPRPSGRPMFAIDLRKLSGIPATHATDPSGNVTTASFDIRGNRLRVTEPFIAGNDAPVTEYSYNAFGQCSSVLLSLDGAGRRRRDVFTYHASGPQTGYLASARRDDGGLNLTTSLEYDARGNLTRRIDPRGSDELLIYNALDQLMRRQSRPHVIGTGLRVATDYFYDGNDNITRVDRENRGEAGIPDAVNPLWTDTFEYDVLDRPTLVSREQSQNSSVSTRYRYDANGNVVQWDLPEAVSGADPNNIVTHTYDERGLPFESVAAPGTGLGAITRYDYDANGNLTRATETGGQVNRGTLYAFDGLDRPGHITDAMGNETLLTRDANGNVVRRRLFGELTDVPGGANNRRLTETRWELDVLDRLTRVRESHFDTATGQAVGDGEAVCRFTYAPNGLTLTQTDDNGRTTNYSYDTANRLLTVADPGLNTVSFTRDANDNVLTRVQTDRPGAGGPSQVFTLTLLYDDHDRCLRASDNGGNNENWAFNSNNQIVRHTDPRGNDSVYEYDGLLRPLRATHYSGLSGGGIILSSSQAVYANLRRTSTTGGNGNVTSFAYDSMDRRTRTTHADGTQHVLVWDTFSDVASEQDANGTALSHTFDLLDRCVRRDIAPAQGVAATTTFEEFSYDGASRMVRAANDGNVHTFVWDSATNIQQQDQTTGGQTLTSAATFDGEGNRLTITHPSGRVVSSTFDALNRPASVNLAAGGPASQVATFTYDGADRLARILRSNGIETRVQWNGDQNSPNAQGDFGWQQVAGVTHQVAGGGAFIDARSLAWDRAQNKTQRAMTVPFTVGGQLTRNTWSCDAMDRLTSSTFTVGNNPPSTAGYQLDPNGNRQVVTENGQARNYQMLNNLPEPADFQMNQYTGSPSGAHQYDRNGNLLSTDRGIGPVVYQYDYAGRLVSVRRTVGPALIPVADYAYDALGRRSSKTVHQSPLPPRTTTFFHDPDSGAIIEERSGGVLSRSYVIPEIGDEVLVAVTAAGQAQYYLGDDLGNVLALTDASGNVIERYDYDDFGAPRFLDANGAPLLVPPGIPATESPAGNPFLFHGLFRDAETALYAGQYDPATGRHIRRTRGVDDGRNENWNFSARGFAGNNPWSLNSAPDSRAGGIDYNSSRSNKSNAIAVPGGGGSGGGNRAEGIDYNSSRSNKSNAIALPGGGGTGGGNRAEGIDYNSSRSNKSNAVAFPGGGGGGGGNRAEGIDYNSSRSNKSNAIALSGGGGGGGSRAEGIDYNSSRSNKSNAIALPGDGGGGGSRAEGIDYNSSRSNKSNAIALPGGGGGGGNRAEGIDYNSSRSNKSNAIALPGGGGGGGNRAEGIDYNSSRSNKSNAIALPGGGGGGNRAEGIDYNSSRSNKSNAIAFPGGGSGGGRPQLPRPVLRDSAFRVKGNGTTIPAGEVNDCYPNVY